MSDLPLFADINDLHKAAGVHIRTTLPDFHIFRNEDISEECIMNMPPHKCGFHQICFDTRSDYTIGLDDTNLAIGDRYVYFIPKGTTISWTSDKAGLWRGFTMMFRSEMVNEAGSVSLFPLLSASKPVVASLSTPDLSRSMEKLCEVMLAEQAKGGQDLKQVQTHLLSAILTMCGRLFDTAQTPRGMITAYETDIKYRFLQLVSLHAHEHREVAYYADRLSLSPKTLSRIIRQTTDMNPKLVIQEKVVALAKHYLSNTSYSISEISHRLGFSSGAQFHKLFKGVTNLSPSGYRQSAAK